MRSMHFTNIMLQQTVLRLTPRQTLEKTHPWLSTETD